MRPKLFLTIVIVLVFLLCHSAKGRLGGQDAADNIGSMGDSGSEDSPQRIVSMAPSVTETLFALGLGERVVGVSRFCNYPAETAGIARIGGVIDPNIEAIVALQPDLAVMLHSNKAICPALHRLGIKMLVVDHKTIMGVLESIPTIGRACGSESAAEKMVGDLQSRIERIRRNTAGLKRPRVLLSVGRNLGTGRLEDVYVAGHDDYFDEMIAAAGGRNVFGDVPVRYPVVSTESIIEANPEIIIDIVPSMGGKDTKAAIADWRQLRNIDAVAAGKVFCLDADYASVPGPRFILLLEKLAELLQGERTDGR